MRCPECDRRHHAPPGLPHPSIPGLVIAWHTKGYFGNLVSLVRDCFWLWRRGRLKGIGNPFVWTWRSYWGSCKKSFEMRRIYRSYGYGKHGPAYPIVHAKDCIGNFIPTSIGQHKMTESDYMVNNASNTQTEASAYSSAFS